MKNIFTIICKKPELFEESQKNMWNDEYISKNMLKAHLNKNLDSATRNYDFVKQSVEWITRILPPTEYPNLLDLGCGPGIYSELFFEKGYNVKGVDLSERSIRFAKKSALQKMLNIEYQCGDYTKLSFEYGYNLISLIYCDFGVLSTFTRKKILSKIYEALLPNGVFLFDVFTPQKYIDVKEIREWNVEKNGFWTEELCLVLHSFYRYDEYNTFLNQYVISTENNIEYFNIWEHTFTLQELKKDLKEAGFTEFECWGNIAGKVYEETDTTMCILARK